MLNFDGINHEIIEKLISSGVDINSPGTYNGNDSYTILHAAIDNNCEIKSIKLILGKNPNVNALMQNYGPIDDDKDEDDSDDDDDEGDDDDDDDDDDDEMDGKSSKVKKIGNSFRNYSPLHIAVTKNRLNIVELLLANGADVNIQVDNCHSVLNTAIKTENIGLIKLLLEAGADVNHISFFKVESKRQTYYLDNTPIPAKLRGFAPLHVAIKCNNLEVVKLLINKGSNPNVEAKNNSSALFMAVLSENCEIVEYLLEHGADVNRKEFRGFYRGYPALHFAIQNNSLDIVKLLISYGAETNDNAQAVHEAIEQNNLELAKFLIKVGFDINVPDNDDGESRTVPLNTALDGTDLDMIEFLLINGADMNCPVTPDEDIFHLFWYCDKYDLLREHIVRVKVLKSHTGDLENVDLSSSEVELPYDKNDEEDSRKFNEWLESFEVKCEEEILVMQGEMIGTSRVSYYELLKKNIYQLGMYAKNPSIATVLSGDEVEETFPIYGAIIKNCFEKGVLRKELLEHVEKHFSDILSKLPHSVVIEIFSYLKNDDLKHFIKYLNIN